MASSSRIDGRAASELRPISLTLGELDRVDGSGRFAFGTEAAVASFSGPMEVRLREELPDKATFEVVHRPLEGVGATPSRALVNTLSAVLPPLLGLAQHPRSLVQLIVQTLSPSPSTSTSTYPTIDTSPNPIQRTWPALPSTLEGGDDLPSHDDDYVPMSGTYFSARAAALNASTLAILDAGSISLRAMPIAVALAYVPDRKPGAGMVNGHGKTGVLLLDASSQEEQRAKSRFVFAWAFGEGLSIDDEHMSRPESEDNMEVDEKSEVVGEAELIWAEAEGEFARQEYEDARKQSRVATVRILEVIRRQIEKRLT